MSETPFVEANALLAVLSADEDEARRILTDFLVSELVELSEGCEKLQGLIWQERRRRITLS